jgi:hypothetical protein
MAKIPTMDEMARDIAQKALDEFYCGDKSLREWMRIIASEDAISKAEVIKLIDKHTNDDGTLDDDITCILEELPPIQSKAKVGKWINAQGGYVRCSECHKAGCFNYNYCPNCGVKMEVE